MTRSEDPSAAREPSAARAESVADSPAGRGRGDGWAAVLVLAMTVAALMVRLATLDFALPYQQEPDPHILGQVEVLSLPEVSDRDLYFTSIYPHLVARTAMLFGAAPVRGAGVEASLEEHLAAASALHVQVRRVVSWLSVLLIPATFWLCRQFQSRGAALFAAALAASSLMSLQFGQQARPHAAVTPLIGLAVAAAVALRRRPGPLTFTGFGVFFAAALGCLTNAAAAALSALPAYALRDGVRGWRRWLDPLLLIPLLLTALSFRCFWPFLFVATPPEAAEFSGAPEVAPSSGPLLRFLASLAIFGCGVLLWITDWLRERSQPRQRWFALVALAAGAALLFSMRDATLHVAWQTIKLANFSGEGFPLLFATLWFYEPVALVLCAVGVVAWLVSRRADPGRERTKDLLVVLAFALVYALVIGLFRLNQQRFAMPLLPLLFCGAAHGMSALAGWATRWLGAGHAHRGPAFVAGLALATPVAATIGYTRMRSRPHTLEQAASWLAEHASSAEDRLAVHLLYDLPLARRESNLFDASGAATAIFSPWQRYQQSWMREWTGERWNVEFLCGDRSRWAWIARNAPAYVEELQATYVLCPGELGAGVNPMMAAVREALRARGELVASFPNEKRPRPSGLSGLDTPHFTRFVLTGRWFGPEVELYRLPPSSSPR